MRFLRLGQSQLGVILAAVATIVVAEIMLLHVSSSKIPELSEGRVIVRTEAGFSPERLVVHKGDMVIFRNASETPSWPASDLHPSHGTYPAFDPQEPLAPGTDWTFVFDTAGTWGFHDHLAANEVGTVVVLNEENVVPTFVCEGSAERESECFKQEVNGVLETRGLEQALDRMAELYESHEAFRDSCHDVAHTLGYAAYDLYAQGEPIILTGKTSYCSYGFYHGFMETMLLESGDVSEAQEFCEEAGRLLDEETTNAKFACYHGIGHGVVDGGDPRDWGNPQALIAPGIEMCDQVNSEEPYFYRCMSGAFNSLAIMYQNEDYGLSFSADDNPFDICTHWDEERVQRPCYGEMNIPVWNAAGGNLGRAVTLVEAIDTHDQAAFAMTSLSGVAASALRAEGFLETITACRSAREDLILPCIRGIPSGIMEVGTPGKEYELALQFCTMTELSEEERVECLNFLFGGVRAYYSEEKQSMICATVEAPYRERCASPLDS